MISTWGWAASRSAQREWVQRSVDCGFDRMRVMINGLRRVWKDRGEFYLNRAGEQVMRLVDLAYHYGLGVDVTTWITPFASFIEGAADKLVRLVQQLRTLELARFPGRDRLCELDFDAEGPWTRKHKWALPHDEAARLIAARFRPILPFMKVSCIGAAAGRGRVGERVGELAMVLPQVEVQAYGASANAPGYWIRRFRSTFGVKAGTVGGRAYKRRNPRITAKRHRQHYESAVAAGVREICYWSARSLGTRRFKKFCRWRLRDQGCV